jgi:glycosyltransferase involved in cell wall biosynthesis
MTFLSANFMKIAYCTNVRLPSERAHGHQVAQVCDALARLGYEVTVVSPYRKNSIREDYHSYYRAEEKVTVRHLGSFDSIASWMFPGVTGLWMLNAMLRKNIRQMLQRESFDALYTRSPALLPALLDSNIPVVLELHQLPRRGRAAFVKRCGQCRLVACLTSHMRETLVAWGVPKSKVIAEGDAVDMKRFEKIIAPSDPRGDLDLPRNRVIVGYVGRLKTLGMEKGVGILLEAIAELKDEKAFTALIVGGPEEDQKFYEDKARALNLGKDDVRFTGEVNPFLVPKMLAACDVLAMPFPDLPHYRHHMSPLKMFEYMAAGKPIVTSDLPTIRDILSEERAYFCTPGDASSLAGILRDIRKNPKEAAKRSDSARAIVGDHTWEARMGRILSAAGLA